MGAVGCLWIGDITVGKREFSGPFPFIAPEGVALRPYVAEDGEGLWDGLRTALQRVHREFGGAGVMAAGAGCWAALALSAQLPVDRLVLIEPRRGDGPLRRMERFARRNLALCVCDALVVCGEEQLSALRAGGLGAHGRLTWLRSRGETGLKLYTNPENRPDMALSCFLRAGELPKSLAENREMCIIYG